MIEFITLYLNRYLELFALTTPLQWLVCFLLLTVTDIAWARYAATSSTEANPHGAARWAVVLLGLGGSAVVSYTANPVLLVPCMGGAYAGTYLGVMVTKWKKRQAAVDTEGGLRL